MRRSTAAFRISADDLDPDQVTKALGIAPASSHRRADLRSTKSDFRWRRGSWHLSTVGHVKDEEDLDAHIRYLLEVLLPRRAELAALRRPGLNMNFFCGLWMDSHNSEVWLPPATLADLAAIGIELGLDIYESDEDDPRSSPTTELA